MNTVFLQVKNLASLESHLSELIHEFKSNDAVHWCSNRHQGVNKVWTVMMPALEQPVLTVLGDMSWHAYICLWGFLPQLCMFWEALLLPLLLDSP